MKEEEFHPSSFRLPPCACRFSPQRLYPTCGPNSCTASTRAITFSKFVECEMRPCSHSSLSRSLDVCFNDKRLLPLFVCLVQKRRPPARSSKLNTQLIVFEYGAMLPGPPTSRQATARCNAFDAGGATTHIRATNVVIQNQARRLS